MGNHAFSAQETMQKSSRILMISRKCYNLKSSQFRCLALWRCGARDPNLFLSFTFLCPKSSHGSNQKNSASFSMVPHRNMSLFEKWYFSMGHHRKMSLFKKWSFPVFRVFIAQYSYFIAISGQKSRLLWLHPSLMVLSRVSHWQKKQGT